MKLSAMLPRIAISAMERKSGLASAWDATASDPVATNPANGRDPRNRKVGAGKFAG
jgi:hypothetical protein